MKRTVYRTLIIILLAIIVFYKINMYETKRRTKKAIVSYIKYSNKYEYYNKPLIKAPKIRLEATTIKADDDFSNLDNNLVYYKTFDPDKKIIIFGHSGAGYGTYFNRIDELSNGDYIYIYYKDKCYKYDFYYKKYIDEKDLSILKKGSYEKVIYLVTCTKKDKKKRLLVVLRQKNDLNAQKISKK